MLTKRQKEILEFIKQYIRKNDYSPSLEEIAGYLGVKSVATVHEHLENLKSKGYLSKGENKARSISLEKEQNASFIEISLLGTIAAGAPIEAAQETQTIAVPTSMVPPGGKYYALRVAGNSMIEEGILDGDTIIVRDQPTVENGETAVAFLPDTNEATLKKIYRENSRIRLQPANSAMKPLYVQNVTIQGKVINIIRSYDSNS